MKCQTLLPLKNSGLHICLSCLFQLSWWHTVPLSPGMVLWPSGKWMEGCFPLFKEGHRAVNEQSGENGKVSHCALSPWRALHHTWRPGPRLQFRAGGELPFRGSVSFSTISKWKCFSHLFFRNYFSSENIQINSLNPSCIFYKTWMSLEYLLCGLFMMFG